METIQLLLSNEDVAFAVKENFRRKRKSQKLSQTELAKRSGVSLGSLKRFEQTGEISLRHLIMLGFALGCPQDFLQLFQPSPYQSIREVLQDATF